MPTENPRIQVTADRELRAALRSAAPHLPADLPRSRQLRELAIIGARHLGAGDIGEDRRRELRQELARSFEEPASAGVDLELLREGKRRAWPAR